MEYQTALGRSDLCFEDDKNLYICEFKVIIKVNKVQSKIDEAKAQIRYGKTMNSTEITYRNR